MIACLMAGFFPLIAQEADEAPDGVIMLEEGEELILEKGKVYLLQEILLRPGAASGTTADGAYQFEFCGEEFYAPYDSKAIRINENVIQFGQQMPKDIELIQSELPLWLPHGTKLCLAEGHRSCGAVILYWNQP